MIRNQVLAFLKQAQQTATISGDVAETTTIQIVVITPQGQYPSLGVVHYEENADFVNSRAEFIVVRARFQPGVYFEKIVPYRDDIQVQVIMSSGSDRVLRTYVGVPIIDKDVRSESNNSVINNMDALNEISLVDYTFQLIDKGFATLRNLPVSNIHAMANVKDSLLTEMEDGSQKAGLTGYESYKGMSFYTPVDNTNNYRQIIFPSGTRLIDVPKFLQESNEYGVYSKGLGAFYKQNYWWIYPLYNTNRVDTHPRPIDLIRVPENKIPDLKTSFFVSNVAFTIISTGKAEQTDHADIRKQNVGVGQRMIMGDAIAGDTGYHYNNGRALTTRADSMQEYKLSNRRNGEEWIPLNPNPTGNIMVGLSQNAMNEGDNIQIEWRGGDMGYLEPGHPVRYQYLYDDDTVMVRKGVLLGYRNTFKAITAGQNPQFKRTAILHVFIKRQDQFAN